MYFEKIFSASQYPQLLNSVCYAYELKFQTLGLGFDLVLRKY